MCYTHSVSSVLNADGLTTLTNLKELLGITASDQDNALERVINRVSKWIESETKRKLKARNYDNETAHASTGIAAENYIYFDGTTKNKGGHTTFTEYGQGEFYLPAWPIQKYNASSNPNALAVELAVLSARGSTISGGETWDSTALLEWDDYIVDFPNGVIRLLAGRFTSGQRNYRFKCTAGYQTGSAQPYVPDDLEALCLELCRRMYENSDNLQSETIGTWSRTFKTASEDPTIVDLLSSYSRPVL